MLRTLALLLVLVASTARAADPVDPVDPVVDDERGPPPNPARGETYDGRPSRRPAGYWALTPPRILLAPFRFTFRLLEWPARWATEFEERHHIGQRLVDMSTWGEGTIGIRPLFTYSLAFVPSGGLRFFHDRLQGRGTAFSIWATTGGADIVHTELRGRPTRAGRPVQYTYAFAYDRRNDYLFAGIGNTTPVPAGTLGPSRYAADQLDFFNSLQLRLARPLWFSVGMQVGWRRFHDGRFYDGQPPITEVYCVRVGPDCVPGTVDEALVPGFNQGTQFVRPSASLFLDLRDDPVRSAVGLIVEVGADYSHGLGADRSRYFRVHGSAGVPIRLWSRAHVLLLHVSTELVAPLGSSAPVPFTELATLGGPNDLRGFRWQLFHGYSSFVATAEYRWPIWMWLDGVVFVDYGGVFGKRYEGFGAAQMQPDVGGGFRVRTRARFHLRVEVAYGFGESWRLYISTTDWP